MKLTVKTIKFLKAISNCIRIINNRNSLDILGNVLLKTEKNQLILKSTNLGIAIITKLGASVEKNGEISVPARLLYDLINSISEDKIQLLADSGNLIIKGQNLNSKINGISASEFPTIPEIETKQKIQIPNKILEDILIKVLISVSHDETRPPLAGIYIENSNQQSVIVTTDSYRLSEYVYKSLTTNQFNCIIPYHTAVEILRLCSQEEQHLAEIIIGKNEICFINQDTTLISQLTEGQYPDYKKIFPKTHLVKIECDKKQLLEAIKISLLFSRESSHPINLNINKNTLIIQSKTSDIGENITKVPIKQVGKPTQISLNARYLLDVLQVINEPNIIIELNNKLDPFIIKPKLTKVNYQHVIMPLKS